MSTSKIKVQDFLSRLPLFSDLSVEELDRIALETTEVRVPRGEMVFQRGDPCTGFHSVVYGQIKLMFFSAHGVEKVVEIVGPGHSFGEAVMFMEKPYIVAARALADSMLLHVARTALVRELESNPRFSLKMLAGLSRRLHGLISDVEALSLRSGTQRVIGYLLKDEAADGLDCVTLQVGKAVIASRLNLTPEHFSRILHDLADHGFISVNGRDIVILEREKLRSYEG